MSMNARSRASGQAATASVLNIIAGIWLIVAPFVLAFTDVTDSMWDSIIIGIAVAIIALIRIWGGPSLRWLSWVNFILGIWMIISPWVFSDSDVDAVLWSDIIAGIVIVLLSLWSALAPDQTVEARR